MHVRFAILTAWLAVAGIGCRPENQPPVGAPPPKTGLRLAVAAPQTVEALKLAGYTDVYAYTWEGPDLGGSIQMHEAELIDLDVMIPAMVSDLKQLTRESSSSLDLSKIKGLIVIAVRPRKDDAGLRECLAAVSLRERDAAGSAGTSRRMTGTVSPTQGMLGGIVDKDHVELYLPRKDKQNHLFFELRRAARKSEGESVKSKA